jgi:hypothetical protein
VSIETPGYEVLEHDEPFELRRYSGYITANVRVAAENSRRAMSAGFNPLAGYIFGNNHASDHISMTAPVTAGRVCCQRIAMTAPVTARQSQEEYVVSFTMPAEYSMEDLPVPNDASVSLETVDPHVAAVIRFSGHLTQEMADEAEARLADWISSRGLEPAGEAIVAQYDDPSKPGFARRNEVMIAVDLA